MMPMGATPEGLVALAMLLALTAYVLLGGADFGAGVWDLLARGPRAAAQRETIAHAIGPVWEANHVWLILVVVLLFTAFPLAFGRIMTDLHVPVSLMLVGIVLRGSAFTFRSYDNSEVGRRRWNRAFSVPSVATPVLLGAILGAIASGGLPRRLERTSQLFETWLAPFPIGVGLFTLALFAFLAATYLTLEADDLLLREDFRRRALGAGVLVGVLAYGVFLLARRDAPRVFHGLDGSAWGLPLRLATGTCALLALGGLWTRHYHVARGSAIVQVVLILWGLVLGQRPYLVPPDLTIANSAAPASTLRFLVVALAAGSLVLFPSIAVMLRVFKAHTLPRRRARSGSR